MPCHWLPRPPHLLSARWEINSPGREVASWGWQKPSKETTWMSFVFLSLHLDRSQYQRVWQYWIFSTHSPKSWDLSSCRKLGFLNCLRGDTFLGPESQSQNLNVVRRVSKTSNYTLEKPQPKRQFHEWPTGAKNSCVYTGWAAVSSGSHLYGVRVLHASRNRSNFFFTYWTNVYWVPSKSQALEYHSG